MVAEFHYAFIAGSADKTGEGLADLFAKDRFNMEVMAQDHEGLSNITGELVQQYGIKVITISRDIFLAKNF